MNRREFIGGSATAGIAAVAATSPLRAMGASDRIRIGLIGAGSRGQQDLRDAIKLPGVECIAVADIYSRRRDEAKGITPNAMMYEDPRRLLDRNDIDAVIVATPVFLHSKYLQDVLAAGKDVYCEKTMTWDIAEAVACRKAANASAQVVQIGLQHESEGALKDAQQWLQQGLVGRVTMVEAWMSRNTRHGEGEWRRPISPDCDAQHVNYPLFLNDRPHEAFNAQHYMNWRLYWAFSGGNVTENMVHQIAWIITALDLKEPVAASMMGGVFSEKDGRQVPDTISVTLEYPNDLVVLWQSTFSNSRYGLGEHFLGRDGTIEHISGATDMVTGRYTGGINYYPEKLNRPDGIALKGEAAGVNHMQNWIDCIRARNKKTNATVEIGYLSAIAAHMSNLSYRTKQRITLEEAMRSKQMY
jgi:predicted dehydrogenase